MKRRLFIGLICVIAIGGIVHLKARAKLHRSPVFREAEAHAVVRTPAEFEQQDAIVASWTSIRPHEREIFGGCEEAFAKLVAAISHSAPVIVLTTTDTDREKLLRHLSSVDSVDSHIHMTSLVATPDLWIRDSGPIVVETAHAGPTMAIFERPMNVYADGARRLASLLGMQTLAVPLAVVGGNLLTNGEGLIVTTESLRLSNRMIGWTDEQSEELMRLSFGSREIVYLESLAGERTQHVDMFATFTDPDTIVVGKYSAEVDPVNSAILDRNAERLSQVSTSRGPLRVVRIPMPPPQPHSTWPSYTNVVYANGTLIVPTYGIEDAPAKDQAVATYRQLLPEWKIVEVDCSQIIRFGGAAHCLTRNLWRIGAFPVSGQPDPYRSQPASAIPSNGD